MTTNPISILRGPAPAEAERNMWMRAWFVAFLVWLACLAAVGIWAFGQAESGIGNGLAIGVTAVVLFYLSLCCLFFPLPTAWAVMLLASSEIGLFDSTAARVVLVAAMTAFATAMANLNEYHIVTFFLRYRAIGKVRDTKLYQRASQWFSISPFWTVTGFSFIPIPVDVIRLLAIASRYSRFRYATAYFLGRFVRYGLLAATVVGLNLTALQIIAIQGVIVLIAGIKILVSSLKRRKEKSQQELTEAPADA